LGYCFSCSYCIIALLTDKLNSQTFKFKEHAMMRRHLVSLAMLAALPAPYAVLAAEGKSLATETVQPSSTASTASSLDGVVEAVRQTTLSAQVAGAIVALRVKAGERVKAGQELLRIDARAAQQGVAASGAQVEAAQAQLKVAARELERQRQLHQKQYVSQAALERAQAQHDAAQAQVRALQAQAQAAQAQSGFFVISAPYSGIVSELPVTLGDMAMPGRPLLAMHDPAALRVTAAVPQALLPSLAGQLDSVRYELPGSSITAGQQKPAHVDLLPTIDPATHTAQIRLALPADMAGVAPGMFARVWLAGGKTTQAGQGQLLVPAGAIVRRAELTAVYVVNEQGQPRLRQLRLGRASGDRIEVLSGLRAGERIATDPQAAAAAAAAAAR
jgi:RND family efflux transporter MFP subunit